MFNSYQGVTNDVKNNIRIEVLSVTRLEVALNQQKKKKMARKLKTKQ